jgi:hypothetical protein
MMVQHVPPSSFSAPSEGAQAPTAARTIMPGYRELPESLDGSAAQYTREASSLEQQDDFNGALRAYEQALAEALRQSPVVPDFICGRLAALYRRLGRYDDEVELLESYRDTQVSDRARMRFDARLSKARAIAEKRSKRESGALESVRAIKKRRGRDLDS